MIAGLDLALTQTGLARPDGSTTAIKWKQPTPTTEAGQLARIQWFTTAVLCELDDVQLVCLEGPSYASTGGAAHERAGLWWQVYDRLSRLGVAVVVIPPKSVKKYATGDGNADKDSVLAEAIRRLAFPGKTNDEADAWVLRAMGLDHYTGLRLVPQSHRIALDKIEWQEVVRAA